MSLATDVQRIEIMALKEMLSKKDKEIVRLKNDINDMYVKRDNDHDKIQELQGKISMLESTVNVQNFAIIVKNRIIEMHRERDRGLPIPHVAIFLDDDCKRPENAEVHDHA